MEQIRRIPTSVKSFGFDPHLQGGLLVEQVEGEATEKGEIARGMVFANATLVFPKSDVQDPMQSIFNVPVHPNHL